MTSHLRPFLLLPVIVGTIAVTNCGRLRYDLTNQVGASGTGGAGTDGAVMDSGGTGGLAANGGAGASGSSGGSSTGSGGASAGSGGSNAGSGGSAVGTGGSAGSAPTTCSQVIADSVADFSSTQGTNGWYYGYYAEPNFNSADFLQLTQFGSATQINENAWSLGTRYWTAIGARGMHPNGQITSRGRTAADHWAVRRWISTVDEILLVRISIYALDTSSNGSLGRIRVGDQEVWQRVVLPGQTLPMADQTAITVRVGDAVNLVLDPYQSDDQSDGTDFEVQICR